jgi:hypothetical protein
LIVLFQFQKVVGFAALKSTSLAPSTEQNAAERLCLAWELRETDSIKTSVQTCTELYEAVVNCPDLSQWLERGGRTSKQRLSAMITRQPLLLARALTSNNIQVYMASLGHVDDDFQSISHCSFLH